MEYRVLRYFLSVVREESITGASKVLHVSQPSLSKQLSSLEEELGKKLFVRGNRKITLTEEGEYFRKKAQEIVNLTDSLEAAFLYSDDKIAGDITFACGEVEGISILIKALKKLHLDYPDVHFNFYTGNYEYVSELLDKGIADFGVFVGSSPSEKYDYIALSSKSRWGLLMRNDNPLATKEEVRIEDLKDQELLCSRQALEKKEISSKLGYGINKLNIVSKHDLMMNTTRIMIEENMGIAMLLENVIPTSGTNLTFIPLAPKIEAGLYLAWKKYSVFSKASKLVFDYLNSK